MSESVAKSKKKKGTDGLRTRKRGEVICDICKAKGVELKTCAVQTFRAVDTILCHMEVCKSGNCGAYCTDHLENDGLSPLNSPHLFIAGSPINMNVTGTNVPRPVKKELVLSTAKAGNQSGKAVAKSSTSSECSKKGKKVEGVPEDFPALRTRKRGPAYCDICEATGVELKTCAVQTFRDVNTILCHMEVCKSGNCGAYCKDHLENDGLTPLNSPHLFIGARMQCPKVCRPDDDLHSPGGSITRGNTSASKQTRPGARVPFPMMQASPASSSRNERKNTSPADGFASSPGSASSSSSDSSSSSSDDDSSVEEEGEESDEGSEHALTKSISSKHVVHEGVPCIQGLTSELNPLLTCILCAGYFVEAHTITECLHTFCKRCLSRHFETQLAQRKEDAVKNHSLWMKQYCTSCPRCETEVESKQPLIEFTRFDLAKQNLVDKIFPRFLLAEKELKASIRKKVASPVIEQSKAKQMKVSRLPAVPSSKRRLCGLHDDTNDVMRFYLNPAVPASDLCFDDPQYLPALPDNEIWTSCKTDVNDLQRIIVKMLQQSPQGASSKFPDQVTGYRGLEPAHLDIYLGDERLGVEHSLDYIFKTKWRDGDKIMVLHYRRSVQQ